MALSKEAYEAFQAVVGPDWVSDDPAVCEADRPQSGFRSSDPNRPKDGNAVQLSRPVCSVMPETTEDVQGIIKACNRYGLPFVASSSYNSNPPGFNRQDVVYLDLKRMRKLEIDEDNLFAVVEPGVASAALQAETFKRNKLMSFMPLSGGECSVLANALYMGEAAMSYRLGDRGYRRVLGVEWVTPDGEILNLGSTSMATEDYFWGEGPGPDLRGLLISSGYGSPARKGVVTKIGVRLFPFISEKLVPTGIAPMTSLKLPANRFKWYNCVFPTTKAAIDAMYEMGKCEICLLAMTVPPWFFSMAKARATGAGKLSGAAAFWDDWNNVTGPAARSDPERTTCRMLLYGIGSDKRLAYEEEVLKDICAEFGGTAKASRGLNDQTHFMSSDAIVSNLSGGRFTSVILFESLDGVLKMADLVNKHSKNHMPPLFEDYGTTNWYIPYDLAHTGKEESLRFTTIEHEHELLSLIQDCDKDFVGAGAFPMMPSAAVYGTAWENYPEKEKKIKKVMDPNNLAP
jgi:glycolate oxidase